MSRIRCARQVCLILTMLPAELLYYLCSESDINTDHPQTRAAAPFDLTDTTQSHLIIITSLVQRRWINKHHYSDQLFTKRFSPSPGVHSLLWPLMLRWRSILKILKYFLLSVKLSLQERRDQPSDLFIFTNWDNLHRKIFSTDLVLTKQQKITITWWDQLLSLLTF